MNIEFFKRFGIEVPKHKLVIICIYRESGPFVGRYINTLQKLELKESFKFISISGRAHEKLLMKLDITSSQITFFFWEGKLIEENISFEFGKHIKTVVKNGRMETMVSEATFQKIINNIRNREFHYDPSRIKLKNIVSDKE